MTPVELSVQPEVCGTSHHPTPTEVAILDTPTAQRMAHWLGFLADPNRLRILSILAAKPHCVGDLVNLLQMSQSAVSHQLRALRVMGLVQGHRCGRHIIYELHDDHVLTIYETVLAHLQELDGL
ncbi:ArsR family transcriptional regulator [Gloeomargarita lithophora Alchichica-D10]|uniref:ArsR family transcriptional regulator n=1 Tax=Gloeomargarita lithophora Alchichica-D10 TaxID=1188229 RepID=A0A1J0AAF2_9CYAN|nr:metalloregulator ArsR/SmtB family transcription factor [Gloeomargarita lithophora]APB32920.1 ArsR family transcriptional regulator [Gloeomargarita lithophora Alchichica-D10]